MTKNICPDVIIEHNEKNWGKIENEIPCQLLNYT